MVALVVTSLVHTACCHGASKLSKVYCMYRYHFVKTKVFNFSELHFSKVTSYKTYTLVKKRLWSLGLVKSHQKNWRESRSRETKVGEKIAVTTN